MWTNKNATHVRKYPAFFVEVLNQQPIASIFLLFFNFFLFWSNFFFLIVRNCAHLPLGLPLGYNHLHHQDELLDGLIYLFSQLMIPRNMQTMKIAITNIVPHFLCKLALNMYVFSYVFMWIYYMILWQPIYIERNRTLILIE